MTARQEAGQAGRARQMAALATPEHACRSSLHIRRSLNPTARRPATHTQAAPTAHPPAPPPAPPPHPLQIVARSTACTAPRRCAGRPPAASQGRRGGTCAGKEGGGVLSSSSSTCLPSPGTQMQGRRGASANLQLAAHAAPSAASAAAAQRQAGQLGNKHAHGPMHQLDGRMGTTFPLPTPPPPTHTHSAPPQSSAGRPARRPAQPGLSQSRRSPWPRHPAGHARLGQRGGREEVRGGIAGEGTWQAAVQHQQQQRHRM